MDDLRSALIEHIADRHFLMPWQAACHADALIAGPLKRFIEAMEAERCRLSDQLHDSCMEHLARDIGDEHDASNLISLAKMYGEACGELQVLRQLLRSVADEEDIAEFLTPIPSTKESSDVEG